MVDNRKRSVGTKESPEYIKKLIVAEARRQGVPVELALAIAQQESGFNNIAVSKPNKDGSRDHGVMQLNDKYHKLKNVYDPVENIRYGIGMIKNGLARNNGNIRKTLSDYNAGPNAVGDGRRKGDAYALKVMTIANRFKPQDINNIIASNAVSNTGEGVTGAAAQVDDVAGDISDRVQALYDAGLRQGEDIVDKYIRNQNYDPSMYNAIRARRQQEIEDALTKINNMQTRATQQDVQNVRDTYANARNALDTGYNNAMQTIQQGMGANQVDDYYNKLAQIDAQRLQEMREANPYTQLSQKTQINPIDMSELRGQQAYNAWASRVHNALNPQGGVYDRVGQEMRDRQQLQAAQLYNATGLTPEQFLEGQMLNYKNMGTTYNNEQQAAANMMQAAHQGDRQAQSLLANIYTTQGTNNANLIKSQYEAERQADEDAFNRAKYNAELAKWGVTQGQSLDTLPVQGDANFQQSKLSNTANTMNTNAQLGGYAGNNLMDYEQKLLTAANKAAEENQSSVDPNIYKALKDISTVESNLLGMNPHVTPDMINQAREEYKRRYSLVVPGLSPILYGNTPNTNYSQFNDITGQSTFRDRPKIK